MKASRTRLATIIADRTLQDGVVSPEYVRELAAYLLAEQRSDEVDSLLRDVQLAWAQAGYVEVLAYTAHALSDAVKADITAEVQKHVAPAARVVITEVLDARVVGGVRLAFAGQQLDMSVQAKLHKLKQLTVGKG